MSGPDQEMPVIAVLSPQDFAAAIKKSKQMHIEKQVSFFKSIPGFENLG